MGNPPGIPPGEAGPPFSDINPPPGDNPVTLTAQATDISPPAAPTDIPRDHMEKYFRDVYTELRNWGMPAWAAVILAGAAIVPAAALTAAKFIVLPILRVFLPAFAGAIFDVLDDLRKVLDKDFAQLSVSVLNELLGTDFDVQHLPSGEDIGAHLARAEEIGFLFHRQLMSEFLANTGVSLNASTGTFSEPSGPAGAGEKITPISGVRAAARFSGLAINFGTATGIIATLGGLAPFVHLDEIREIGEDVAKNLGLGRLQRLALAPIVKLLLADPYQWFISEFARPKQLTAGDVVNPFSGNVMDASLIWRDLAREGYSDDKIQALLDLHRKKPGEAELLTLFEGGHIDDQSFQDELKHLGYNDAGAGRKFEADHLKAQRPFQDEVRAAAVTAYTEGHIDRGELESIVGSMPLSADEKALVLLGADYKKKVPSKHLTLAELDTAYDQGIIDLTEWRDHLTNLGYSDDDQSILLLLMLNKLQQQKEKAAATAARNAAKNAKKTGAPPASPLPPATPAP